MDGTLLNGKGELDPAFFPLFRELELRGIRFAAASGRQSVSYTHLEGASMLWFPNHQDIALRSVGGLVTPDYWNFAMFKGISESLRRPVSPGTASRIQRNRLPLLHPQGRNVVPHPLARTYRGARKRLQCPFDRYLL